MSHTVRIADADVSFACGEAQTVLDAALQAGIELPYSCRKGACENCLGQVCSGEVRDGHGARGGPGSHLLCQAVPLGDLEIRPQSWRRLDPGARKTLSVKVYRNTRVADDVSVLDLRLPAGQRVRFQAGQYLQVLLADGSRRSYSMANAPHESDSLQLHVRHVSGGLFTGQLAGLVPGSQLQVELPFGQAGLRDAADGSPVLCVVGGTGFAPAKSVLDDLLKKGAQRPVTLVWGGRDRNGLYLMAAVERWQKRLPGFNFIAAIEDATDAAALGAFHGRVDAAVSAHCSDLSGHQVLCCGAPPMVAAVKRLCVEQCGLPGEAFHSDAFVPGPA